MHDIVGQDVCIRAEHCFSTPCVLQGTEQECMKAPSSSLAVFSCYAVAPLIVAIEEQG